MTFLQSTVILFASEAGVWRADWAWGIPLIVFTLVVHVLGMGLAHQTAVGFFARQEKHRRPMAVFVVVISTVTVWATCLHAAETALWAVLYELLGARPDYASAMLYSMGAITTYGHSGLYLQEGWQLMGAIEALSGWLLFGLTTAFLFSLIQKCRDIAGR
jgi:hypothetical protein